jgi:hypothetical protein
MADQKPNEKFKITKIIFIPTKNDLTATGFPPRLEDRGWERATRRMGASDAFGLRKIFSQSGLTAAGFPPRLEDRGRE